MSRFELCQMALYRIGAQRGVQGCFNRCGIPTVWPNSDARGREVSRGGWMRLLLVGMLGLSFSYGSWAGSSQGFRVFDGTQFSGKPDLTPYGVEPAYVIYESAFWPRSGSRDSLPTKHRVQELARQAIGRGKIAVLDIERWRPGGSHASVAAAVHKYVTVLRWFREAAPSLPVGYYGTVPVWGGRQALLPHNTPGYKTWQATNEQLRPIAESADIIFPGAYTMNGDLARWVRTTEADIGAARGYGKKVYVFLWPRYAGHDPWYGGSALPASVWATELETVWRHADGVVIWGGWDSRAHKGAKWNPDAPWWQVTKRFLCAKHLVAVQAVCPPGGHTDSAPVPPARPRLSGSPSN